MTVGSANRVARSNSESRRSPTTSRRTLRKPRAGRGRRAHGHARAARRAAPRRCPRHSQRRHLDRASRRPAADRADLVPVQPRGWRGSSPAPTPSGQGCCTPPALQPLRADRGAALQHIHQRRGGRSSTWHCPSSKPTDNRWRTATSARSWATLTWPTQTRKAGSSSRCVPTRSSVEHSQRS